jgi:ribosomal-protein-alanine N-acetyltransferase
MAWYGRQSGRSMLGLIDMEVNPLFRRKGYGRHLVQEILRFARSHSAHSVAVQTRATNLAAIALYQAAGFDPMTTTTLYRKPG